MRGRSVVPAFVLKTDLGVKDLLYLSIGDWFAGIRDWIVGAAQKFAESFKFAFIDGDRWQYMVGGLKNTLLVTIFALILGVALGIIVAVVRSTADTIGRKRGFGNFLLRFFNKVCKIYLTVIRGTPVAIQLLIMYFIIFGSSRNTMLAAILSFGINSGAYVAEIVRGGIMGVDPGQSEAGRSLGLGYISTMQHIVVPQAIKSILPALGNELITLLKETSVCTFIGLTDITKGATIIQGRTFQAFFPLLGAAAMYLVMVMILSWLLGKLERRLRKSDRR